MFRLFGDPLLQRRSLNHLSCFVDASALEEGKDLVSVDVTRQYRIAFGLNIVQGVIGG